MCHQRAVLKLRRKEHCKNSTYLHAKCMKLQKDLQKDAPKEHHFSCHKYRLGWMHSAIGKRRLLEVPVTGNHKIPN